MDDLRRRFASLDRVPAPDLWHTIEVRAAAPEPMTRVTAVVSPVSMRSRRSTHRSLVLILATAVVLVALMAGALVVGSRRAVLPAFVPVPSASAVVASGSPAVEQATGSPVDGEVVLGWPSTRENAAGVYSLDGSRCSSTFCVVGFMHNGQGSGDIEIRIHPERADTATGDGATAVTVAGHDGIYRRTDRLEQWIFVVDGQTMAIDLEARPGTSAADLAEAYAIIRSMRTEPQDNYVGFRLVFTLATDDRDSG